MKTERDIQTALLKLLREKTFDKITIADICATALTGRSTFYDHYTDKYALLEQMVAHYTDLFARLMHDRLNVLMSESGDKALIAFYKRLQPQGQAILTLLDVHEENADLTKNIKQELKEEWTHYLDTSDRPSTLPRDFMVFLGTDVVMSFIRWSLTHTVDEAIAHFAGRFRQAMFE
ncbi:TetR/AcrR family transcriptional regulator [Lactobacillus selangorensis]|uniref:TetR/AcrR family transcriptional regulator n=1 Tax=Lactobacillus selangorensis TaxID=81857 RepID=UPI001EEE9424|nr:TetR family transcriptional regulator [Lactobacillus selangorensis]